MAKTLIAARPLNFEDTPQTWGTVLCTSPEDASNVKLALSRLVTSMDPAGQAQEFRRIIKDLRGAAQNTNTFMVCLGEAEFRGLYFETVDEAIRVFRWIDAQCAAAIQALPETRERRRGRRAGRVQKDLKYWNRVIGAATGLFAYFQGHWTCGLPTFKTPSSGVLIASFELAYTINGIIPPCFLLQVVQTASEVGITPDLIKQLVLAHHPMRVGDFTALMRDGLLTPTTYWELASRPGLVAALSYKGLRHLLTAWKEHPDEELLAFARGIVAELYPQGIPMGENPVWARTPTNLLSFLVAVQNTLRDRGAAAFEYTNHTEGSGRYVPRDARILLSPETDAVPPAVDPLEEDEDIVLEMPSGDQDEDFVDLTLEVSLLDGNDLSDPSVPFDPSGLSTPDDEVHTLWAETSEARARADHDRLALLDDLSEEPPVPKEETTPWTDVHALIAMDARASREGVEDLSLQALLVDIGEVEHLLDLAARGDTDGVLGLWSAWMDPVRDRIHELDARLKELASRPATVIETVVVPAPALPTSQSGQAVVEPPPIVEVVSEPEPEPAPAPPPAPPPAPELPPLPDGELGMLFADAYAALVQMPVGSMKRQLRSQLEALRKEALEDGNPRSLRPRVTALKKEVDDFLNIINDN